ncbi:hypothetical protein DFJ77DRAFT_471876 [Powellomyces hirtus]|nr:hypothetical protein DFJ77DRAFT_471876 [Powellomyces hirtus]
MALVDAVESLKWFCSQWASYTLRDSQSPLWQQRVQIYRKAAGQTPYLISKNGSALAAISFLNGFMEITYVEETNAIKDSHLNQAPRIAALLKVGCSVQVLMGNLEWTAVMSDRYGGTLNWNTSPLRRPYDGLLIRIGSVNQTIIERLANELLYVNIPTNEDIIHDDPTIGQLLNFKSQYCGHVYFRHSMVTSHYGPFRLHCGINLFHENPETWAGDKWEMIIEKMLDLWGSALRTVPEKTLLLYDQINKSKSIVEAQYIAKHSVLTQSLTHHFTQRHGTTSYPWPSNVPMPGTDRRHQLVLVSPDLFWILQRAYGSYEEHMGRIFQVSRNVDMNKYQPVEEVLNSILRGRFGIDGFIFKMLNVEYPRCLLVGQVCYLHARLLIHANTCHPPNCRGWLTCIICNIVQAIWTELAPEEPNFASIADVIASIKDNGEEHAGHSGLIEAGDEKPDIRMDTRMDTTMEKGQDQDGDGEGADDELDVREIVLVYAEDGKVQSEDIMAGTKQGSWGFFRSGDVLHIL